MREGRGKAWDTVVAGSATPADRTAMKSESYSFADSAAMLMNTGAATRSRMGPTSVRRARSEGDEYMPVAQRSDSGAEIAFVFCVFVLAVELRRSWADLLEAEAAAAAGDSAR